MSVNLGVWDKLMRVVVVVVAFLAILVWVFSTYLPLIERNQHYRKRIFDLDAKIQEQEKVGRQLRASIDAVQTDPRTLERLAREKLGWARSNETVVRFESQIRR
jgi:cell division protein FtsB